MASVIDAEGRVDILVNNAGIVVSGDVEGTALATFQSVMNTNLWGTLRCIQAVLPDDARAAERLHRERHVDRRPGGRRRPGRVRGVEVGGGGR